VNLDLSAMDDSWETCVSAGIVLAQNLDAGRWSLGDLTGRVEKRYGADAIGNFATEIGMARKSTLKEYRRVSARYSPDIRMAFSEALSWSHFQAACRAKDDAELWLARAADENWPVAEMARQIAAAIGKPVAPRLLYSGRGVVWQYADTSRPYLVLHDDVSALAQGLSVIVKVYEATGEA
jgi:hypothetical protein